MIGKDVRRQKEIDQIMMRVDNTDNKARLGANAILGVSLASARAASKAQNLELYLWLEKLLGKVETIKNLAPKLSSSLSLTPAFNLINGGQHADNNLDIQEFWFLPTGAASLSSAIRMAVEVYQSLIKLAKSKGLNVNVGDEGGIAPELASNKAALDLIQEAASLANFKADKDYVLGLDAAASSFFDSGQYKFEGQLILSQQLSEIYQQWLSGYPIKILEDPFAEEDWSSWQEFTKQLGDKLVIVGDDLLVTNPNRLKIGMQKQAANAILIKLNQIGTVSETIETIKIAKENGWQIVVSHRSGETNDDFIADLAVGIKAAAIKSGAPARGERVAKYNRLMKII